MRSNKLPDILEINSIKCKEERIIYFRKFLADLRLNRLYFHLLILDFFSNLDKDNNKMQAFSDELNTYLLFFKEIDNWLDSLRKNGVYEEFKEQCLQEAKAIEQIIQSYEGRMKNNHKGNYNNNNNNNNGNSNNNC